jgi:hypothetical protein
MLVGCQLVTAFDISLHVRPAEIPVEAGGDGGGSDEGLRVEPGPIARVLLADHLRDKAALVADAPVGSCPYPGVDSLASLAGSPVPDGPDADDLPTRP